MNEIKAGPELDARIAEIFGCQPKMVMDATEFRRARCERVT